MTESVEAQPPAVADELKAMQQIVDALDPLDTATRGRVLQWVANRFALGAPATNTQRYYGSATAGGTSAGETPAGKFSDLPSLFEAADPATDTEKALVVGYWHQQVANHGEFGSQAVNTELKHLGHAVGNITAAFTNLIRAKYALQIKKSGTSQQARKRYKLTLTGIKLVEEMLTQQRPAA